MGLAAVPFIFIKYESRWQFMSESKSELLEWIEAIVIALVLAFFIRTFLFEVIKVEGSSMMPTLYENNRLVVNKLGYRFSSPKQGDIIIFRNPDNMKENYIKRVIAVPGQTVEVKDGSVKVDDKTLAEFYIAEPPLDDFNKVEVPQNTIFVMGDNRNHSRDSRHIGFIPYENVLGKAKWRIWPINDMKWFK